MDIDIKPALGQDSGRRRTAARVMLVWAALAVLFVAVGIPQGARLVVVAPFALVGVGLAVLVHWRGVTGPAAFAVALLAGLSSLVLISSALVYAGFGGSSSGLATVALQSLLVLVLLFRDAFEKRGE